MDKLSELKQRLNHIENLPTPMSPCAPAISPPFVKKDPFAGHHLDVSGLAPLDETVYEGHSLHQRPQHPPRQVSPLWFKTAWFWDIKIPSFPRAWEWAKWASKRTNERSKRMSERCEQTDKRVAQYLHLKFWLIWTTVQSHRARLGALASRVRPSLGDGRADGPIGVRLRCSDERIHRQKRHVRGRQLPRRADHAHFGVQEERR